MAQANETRSQWPNIKLEPVAPLPNEWAIIVYVVQRDGVYLGRVAKQLPSAGRGWRWYAPNGGTGTERNRALAVDALREIGGRP